MVYGTHYISSTGIQTLQCLPVRMTISVILPRRYDRKIRVDCSQELPTRRISAAVMSDLQHISTQITALRDKLPFSIFSQVSRK